MREINDSLYSGAQNPKSARAEGAPVPRYFVYNSVHTALNETACVYVKDARRV